MKFHLWVITTFYDPDIKIYLFKSICSNCKVFFKSPSGTPYENIWCYLYVSFKDSYQTKKPEIRFIIVPYHLNMLVDVKICSNFLEKNYVIIIQEIK